MREMVLIGFLQAQNCTNFAGSWRHPDSMSDFLSPDGIRTTADLAQALLDEARVALTPGEAFDAPGFIRISYATSLGELQRGSDRILQFFRSVEHRGRAAAGA